MKFTLSRGLLLALLFVASTALADENATATPHDPCLATLQSPKLLFVSPAVLPTDVWEKKLTVRARVHFRVDESGHPIDVKANVIGNERDELRLALEQAIGDAFARNRYCTTGDFRSDAHWAANLLFSPGPKLKDVDGIYIQSFVPTFVGYETYGHHNGAVVVRGLYGTDGRPQRVEIVSSSGDKILDDKSLDTMASAHLIFQNGVAPQGPVTVTRPINFRQ